MRSIDKKRGNFQRQGPVCPIEGIVAVSPLAVVALAGVLMQGLGVATCLPGHLFKAAASYLGGLLWLDRKATATRMAQVVGGVSHDALTRLLSRGRWRCSGMMLQMVRLVVRMGKRGYLCLDDTLIPRPRSRKVEGAYWDHDHALGKNVCGHRVVVLLWSDGFWRIPLAFGLWHKKGARRKYRTKNEIARLLVRWVLHQGIQAEYLAFDNWYASKENMKMWVHGLGLPFVTKLKCNHRLHWEGRRLQARTIGRRLTQDKRVYRFSDLDVWARSAAVHQPGVVGNMTFVVVKDELDGEKPTVRYLLASTPRLAAREVVRRYKTRWIIEVFFHDLKQMASLTGHQGQKQEAVYHHVAFSMLALVMIDALRKGTALSAPEVKQILQRLVCFQTQEGTRKLGTLSPATAEDTEHLDQLMETVRCQLHLVTPLVSPEKIYAQFAA